jgi:hypothetical protein
VATHGILWFSVDTILQESPYETIIMNQFLEMPTRNDFMIGVGSENKEAHLSSAVLPFFKKKKNTYSI